jgi:predicted RNA-binding Zn ribbon-like protein
MPHPADFRFYLGSLSLNFAATVRRLKGEELERIPTERDFDRWLVAAGLVPGPPGARADQYRSALELREAIYRTGLALIEGRAPEPADVAELNRSAARASSVVQLDAGTLLAQCCSDLPVDAALAQIAADAIRLFGSPDERKRLRKCEACDQLMLSAERGRARRWCSMQVCGNRAKVAAFRERTKQ